MWTVGISLAASICFVHASGSVLQAYGQNGNSKSAASVPSRLVRKERRKPEQSPLERQLSEQRLQYKVKGETLADYVKPKREGGGRKIVTFEEIGSDLSLLDQNRRLAVRQVADDFSVGMQPVEFSSNASTHAQSSHLPASEIENIKDATGFTTLCRLDRSNKSFARFADKAGVKDYVRSLHIDISVPETFLLVEHESEITMDKFEKLPSHFVMKGTHGSGMTVVVNGDNYACVAHFCAKYKVPQGETPDDRLKFLKDTCSGWLGFPFGKDDQLFYTAIKPKCIFEEFVEQNDDWKIHTIHGTPIVIQVDKARYAHHMQSYYTPSWHKVNISDLPKDLPTWDVPKPLMLPNLLEAASSLAAGHSHVRVDLYLSKNKVYFSELTYTPQDCLDPWRPQIMDQYLGYMISNPSARRLPDDILDLLQCESCLQIPTSLYQAGDESIHMDEYALALYSD